MKKRKHFGAKIVAFIALAALIIGIVGTSILFVVSSLSAPTNQNQISPDQLQEFLDNAATLETSTGSDVAE